jgi:hypothetical protein
LKIPILTGDTQKAYGLNKAISIYFSLYKMAILDVIFPKKSFCTSCRPIFWSQSGELLPEMFFKFF